MRTNKLLVFATIALVIINLVLAYFLWNNKRSGRGHDRERKQERGDWIVKELNLDDNQKEEHKRIKDAHFNSMKPVFDSISAARRALYDMIKDPSVNDSTIAIYSAKIGSYHTEITRLTFDHFRQMRSILNPAQQEKLDTLMQKIVSDMGRRKKSRGE
jgi:Spy/CpxP family protein refolding chaperone